MRKLDEKRCKFYQQCRQLQETCATGESRLCFLGKNPLIKMLSGKVPFEKIVCVSHKNEETYYARGCADKKVTIRNEIWGTYMSNIVFLWTILPLPVKENFQQYAKIENKFRPKRKGNVKSINIFIQGIGRQVHQIETLEDISTHLGNSVFEWVRNGHLTRRCKIKGLDAQIIP
ncbi:MAG: hypothetical protein FWG20_05600 [Candidatus Cloacimonetes bacterium]|nr:hypothetical protein [Candidatus Cloacimonadota bacterium]